MKQAINLFFMALIAALLIPQISIAQNMADGLQCPSGWQTRKRVVTQYDLNQLLKQCTPPTNDAVIQLYSKVTSASLTTELNKWTQYLKSKGLPYQRLLNEQPGHVSGYPAILRFFSGWDRTGKWYDSYLVVSRYKGTNYIFIGYAMKGHDQVRIQMRNAMNAWHYPGVSGPTNSGYSSTNNNQQPPPNYGPNISQNNNPSANVNINPTVNVNRPGCTRQTSQSSTYTNTNNNSGNSYSNSQDSNYSNSGNTYQNTQDTKPDNPPADSNNNNSNQNTDRPSDNKYLDYILK